ncbi:MAG: type II secretion system protein [Deltaproteobacteria bacterium]|nr:type II secretion system protein [Deltaproteobacteria bacterium]
MKRGFTLIEVMLGLALLALVLSIVQGVYSGATRTRERSHVATENLRAAALLLQRVTDELGSAVPETLEITSLAGETSALEFTTEFPQFSQEKPTSGEKTEGAFARLRYELATESDGTQSLVRRSGFEIKAGEEPELGTPDTILPNVARFRVQWSSDAKEWRNSYSGSSSGSDRPVIVSVEVSWRDGGPEEPERVLRTSVPLYRVLG